MSVGFTGKRKLPATMKASSIVGMAGETPSVVQMPMRMGKNRLMMAAPTGAMVCSR